MRKLCFAMCFMCPRACSTLLHTLHGFLYPTLSSSTGCCDRYGDERRQQRRHQTWQVQPTRPRVVVPLPYMAYTGTATPRVATTRSRTFESNEAVSYFRNPAVGSEIWLVGVIHDAKASSRLVEKVIGRIKPKVVMVEVDEYRIGILPPGEASEDEDGLCWWSPLGAERARKLRQEVPQMDQDGEVTFGGVDRRKTKTALSSVAVADEGQGLREMVTRSKIRIRQKKKEQGKHEETEENTCEFNTAARKAVACGARVLLGDRNFQETERRLAEAETADKEDAPSTRRRKAGVKKGVEARIKRRGLEAATPAMWRKMRDLEKSWKPRKFAVLITERDEVMANNLLTIGGNQETVAIVGAHHLVGIGRILADRGWKTWRKR